MSTLQSNPRGPHTRSTRIGAGVVALGALIAIGVSVLILALIGTPHTASQSAAAQSHPAAVYTQPARQPSTTASRAGYFRDPTTHALIPIPTPDSGPGHVNARP